jgi:hypothetical protein
MLEIIGTTLFFATVGTAEGLKQAVIRLEGVGNVVTRVEPVYEFDTLKGAFIHVAGDAKPLAAPGTSNAG